MSKEKKYYPQLDWMRAIAILLVISTHASYNEVFNANSIVAYIDIFAHLSVPLFVFISGFLMFDVPKEKILSRLPRILLPYLLFSLFCQIIKFRTDLSGNIGTILYNILTGDSFGIYYFVFVLFYLYFWGMIVNKYKKYINQIMIVLLLVTIPFLIFSTIKENNLYFISRELYYRFPLNWLFLFTFGMWMKFMESNKEFYTVMFKQRFLFLIGFILSIVLIFISNSFGLWVIYTSLPWFIYSLLGILTLFLFLQFTPPVLIKYLSNTSYSIFLAYILPLAFLYYFFPISDAVIVNYSLPLTVFIFFLALLISIIVREVSKIIFKSASNYIVGS
jgi:surface polysaccharide O-acyltransferase-like enzyme